MSTLICKEKLTSSSFSREQNDQHCQYQHNNHTQHSTGQQSYIQPCRMQLCQTIHTAHTALHGDQSLIQPFTLSVPTTQHMQLSQYQHSTGFHLLGWGVLGWGVLGWGVRDPNSPASPPFYLSVCVILTIFVAILFSNYKSSAVNTYIGKGY